MRPLPPRPTLTDTLFPSTRLFRYICGNAEGVHLVAVGIAEVGRAKAMGAGARRAVTASAMSQGRRMDAPHHVLACGHQREHRAVAPVRRFAIERIDRKSTRLNSSH